MDASTYTMAAMAAQGVLRTADPTLVVDGKFGTTTQSAYNSAPAGIKGAVERVVKALGVKFEDILSFDKKLKITKENLGGAQKFVSRVDVDALIRRAAARLSRPDIADKVLGFVDLEANKKVIDGVTYYDVLSVSPNKLYKGLMQIGQGAWADATLRLNRVGYTLPPFGAGWQNPEYNIFAGVAYAVINSEVLKSRNIPVTPETLYGAHNQGAGGFSYYVRTGTVKFPKQSGKASEVLAKGRDQSLVA